MTDATISINPIAAETLRVPLASTAPLIIHRFSEKAKRQMLDNAQGRKAPKEPKDPQAEYEAAFYRLDDGTVGFPTLAFKAATIGAARYFDKSVSMVLLRQCLFFKGEATKNGDLLSRVTGTDPHMREDVVRLNKQGSTDLRYRPQIDEWSTELEVTFVKSMLTRDSVVSLIEAGGMGVGVGEWRPEKSGQFGTYRVDPDREIEVIG